MPVNLNQQTSFAAAGYRFVRMHTSKEQHPQIICHDLFHFITHSHPYVTLTRAHTHVQRMHTLHCLSRLTMAPRNDPCTSTVTVCSLTRWYVSINFRQLMTNYSAHVMMFLLNVCRLFNQN